MRFQANLPAIDIQFATRRCPDGEEAFHVALKTVPNGEAWRRMAAIPTSSHLAGLWVTPLAIWMGAAQAAAIPLMMVALPWMTMSLVVAKPTSTRERGD